MIKVQDSQIAPCYTLGQIMRLNSEVSNYSKEDEVEQIKNKLCVDILADRGLDLHVEIWSCSAAGQPKRTFEASHRPSGGDQLPLQINDLFQAVNPGLEVKEKLNAVQDDC